MPRRDDISRVLLLGSGPIVVGQGAEFDYSGTQACRALREEGVSVVLVNSNPATIMTDPETADRVYVEPLTPDTVEAVLEAERPDSLLPTLGGQTALNVAMALHGQGTLERLGVRMIGAQPAAIRLAEDREAFAGRMREIGLAVPRGGFARSLQEGRRILAEVGYPAILRPSYTLGGTGGGIAYNVEEFEDLLLLGLDLSPIGEVLVETSVVGWKEFELEVMRDRRDNVVVVCSIENLDPMGVHTGDSITVAPQQTLTDREYQAMRDDALRIMRAVHSKEVAVLTGLMAGELGLDVGLARRGGFLHDVGKAMTHEAEGSHTQIGYELARRLGEHAVVLNCIAAHHDDVPHESPLSVLVQAADAMSGARPGARRETLEAYVRRLEKLESIAESMPGVFKSYAVQAGRELRVMVVPEEVDDKQAAKLSEDVARKIEDGLHYPGQIKVVVIRETRAVEYAR